MYRRKACLSLHTGVFSVPHHTTHTDTQTATHGEREREKKTEKEDKRKKKEKKKKTKRHVRGETKDLQIDSYYLDSM